MEDIKRILSVVDPTTDTQPAMQRAAWLAEKTGAELELLICYYNESLSGDRLFDSPSLEKARQEIIKSHESHLEKLAGKRKGQHSIRINIQWRICFEWSKGDAYNVEIVDYH